jgi:hypothetical protein
MIPFSEAWNGTEPAMDALKRHELVEVFEPALCGGDNRTAVRALVAVGVDHGAATMPVDLAFKALKSGEN